MSKKAIVRYNMIVGFQLSDDVEIDGVIDVSDDVECNWVQQPDGTFAPPKPVPKLPTDEIMLQQIHAMLSYLTYAGTADSKTV